MLRLASDKSEFIVFLDDIRKSPVIDEEGIYKYDDLYIRIEEIASDDEIFGVVVDCTIEMNKIKEIEKERDIDVLTGLYNRRGLDKQLDKLFAEHDKLGYSAIVMIDADGLDYVCRDVWAGGYRNFTIDIDRLINSIEIVYNNTSGYSVAYNAKALNEIETVLNIKNFQYLYVIKHHKVLLEQYLLVEAMKFTACYHLDLPDDSADERDNALRSLCDYHAYITPKSLSQSKYKLHRPTDDDFVALMKLYDTENMYIKQWFSRKYDATPLWKSKMEYFSIFKPVFQSLSEEEYKNIHTILMSPECKHYLCCKFNLQESDIIVIEVKPKLRKLEERIYIKLNDNIKPYSELSHDMFSVVGTELSFCYMYINLNTLGGDNKKMHIKTIISKIKDFLLMELREKWDE